MHVVLPESFDYQSSDPANRIAEDVEICFPVHALVSTDPLSNAAEDA